MDISTKAISFFFWFNHTLKLQCCNKIGYFIILMATELYYGLDNLNPLRIKNFSQFEKIIDQNIFNKQKKKLKIATYCLKSDKVSERVYKYLKKYR